MWKEMCVCALAALCCWSVAADPPDFVTMPATTLPDAKVRPILETAGYWTLDYVTGELTEGTFQRSELIYDNTTTSAESAYVDPNTAPPVAPVGDGVWMAGDGLLQSLSFSIYNDTTSGGPLTRVDVQVNFLDGNVDPSEVLDYQLLDTVFIDDLTVDPPLDPGSVGYFTVENLGTLNITIPRTCLWELACSDMQGGATALGQAIYDPPTVGESPDAFYVDYPLFPGWYWFSGDPIANFYFAIGVDRSPTVTIYDMGAQHTVHRVSDNTDYWIGFTSGYYDATTPQRWSAIPFYVDQSGVVITEIIANWFIITDPPCQADSVNAFIWHRTGLDRPTSFDDLFWEGIIGPYEIGDDSFREDQAFTWGPYHNYGVNIPIPPGDYYLTIYADGGATPNALAWLTGGDRQDEALETGFMWRSATFPSPGFQVYNNPDLQPGPEMVEYDDVWNCTFMLRGTVVACIADLDGDGDTDLSDLAQLLGNYGETGMTFEDGDLD
ncbi:MAG: hypothetical protein KKI02_05610, partial [Planctomycetes bacterium]|nr:hypothetical protein [Planctomycetota bacterium]